MTESLEYPLHVFRFLVEFMEDSARPNHEKPGRALPVCGGAFSECTGLEATMEPKVIKEGGTNYGPAQRVGQVTFATVVLKRGISVQYSPPHMPPPTQKPPPATRSPAVTRTPNHDLWDWFSQVTSSSYAHRRTAKITMFDPAGGSVLAWQLERTLPTKLKTADLNARGTEIGIEELHLAHEGLIFLGNPRTVLKGSQV